jgi:hypothetical protein
MERPSVLLLVKVHEAMSMTALPLKVLDDGELKTIHCPFTRLFAKDFVPLK